MSFRAYTLTLASLTLLIQSPSLHAEAAKANLRIGAVLPLSGPLADYGEEVIHGMEIAIQDLKQNDADLASRLQIVRLDDKSMAAEASKVGAKAFEERKVDLLFGSLTSSTTQAMIKSVTAFEKPVVAPTATSPGITKGGNYVFTACYIDSFQGFILAKFATKDLKKTKAAILTEETSDYSKSIAKVFEKEFTQMGGTVVASKTYATGATDFKAVLTALKKTKPQILVVPGYYQEVARIMEQAKQVGLIVPLLGGDGWESPNLYKIAGKEAINGHYYVTHFSADDSGEAVQNFVATFQKNFKRKPTMLAAMGYDGLMLIADAFKRARTPLANTMIQALGTSTGVLGLIGEMRINKEHNAEKSADIIQTTTSGGRFKTRVTIDTNG